MSCLSIFHDFGAVFSKVLGVFVLDVFELVKISVSLKRELDFQGLHGFVSVCFVLFFGACFLDGFGNGFLTVFMWIWGLFWLLKSMKNGIDFGIDF